jgi:hypothetical protein
LRRSLRIGSEGTAIKAHKQKIRQLNAQIELTKVHVLDIPNELLNTTQKQNVFLQNIKLGNTEILRLSNVGEEFTKTEMKAFMRLLQRNRSHVWGLNLGEFNAEQEAWRVFAEEIPDTWIGFAYVGEAGKKILKDQGYRFEGRDNILRKNRQQKPEWYLEGKDNSSATAPWWDGKNLVFRHALARKFFWNPERSKFFKKK